MADITPTEDDLLLSKLVNSPTQTGGDLARGWRGAVQGLKGAGGGLISMAGRGFGAPRVEAYGNEIVANANEAAAAESAAGISSVEQVGGFGDAIDLAQYAVGNALPSILMTILGGGVGGAAGAFAARNIAAQATKALVRQTGMVAGGAASSFGQATGSVYNEAIEEKVDAPMSRAILGGAGVAALDLVAPLLALRKLGILGDVAGQGKKGWGALGLGAAKGLPAGAIVEGGTEGLQRVVERAATDQDLTGPEAYSEYLNSAVMGAIPGALIGGGVGAVDARRAARALPPPPSPAAIAPPLRDDPAAPETPLPGDQSVPNIPPAILDMPPVLDRLNEAPRDPIQEAREQMMREQAAEPIAPKDEYAFVVEQREQAQVRLAELQAENKLPAKQRRKKEVIAQDLKSVNADLAYYDADIAALKPLIAPPLSAAIENVKFAKRFDKLDSMERAAEAAPAEVVGTFKSDLNLDFTAPDAIPAVPAVTPVAALEAERALPAGKRRSKQVIAKELKIARATAQKTLFSKAKVADADLDFTQPGTIPNADLDFTQPGAIPNADLDFTGPDAIPLADLDFTKPGALMRALEIGRANGQLNVRDPRTGTNIDIRHPLFDSAQQYNRDHGLTPVGGLTYKPLDKDLGRRAAEAFEQLPRESNDPAVLASYAAMVRESAAQFEYASKVITIEPWTGQGQPYASSNEMRHDVFENKHLYIFPGGDSHALLTAEQIYKMRAVHDLYGHAQTGFEFGPRGEQNAARAHAQMYSDLAIAAHMTEFFGFNSWTMLSKTNEGKPASEVQFATNRAGLMPEGLWRELLGEVFEVKAAANDRFDAIYAEKGREYIEFLRNMVGDDPTLKVHLYHAGPEDPAGSYTRVSKYNSLIAIALNQGDVLSTLAHEGFHYLVDRALKASEKHVLQRAFSPGKPLFERAMAEAQKYDRLNGTTLADEILSKPDEAQAYGFQFHRLGLLKADGAVGRIFDQLRNLIERIVNFIRGSGFQSAEDIMLAIQKGKYAKFGSPAVNTVGMDNSNWAQDVEPDLVDATQYSGGTPASQAKGRPYWVKTGADVVKMRARLKRLALEGEAARNWHAESAAAILAYVNGDVSRAAVVAALISNFSPRTPVGLDLKKALTALIQFEAGQTIAPGAPKQHIEGAKRILIGHAKNFGQDSLVEGKRSHLEVGHDAAGNVPPTGIKRINFFKNLMLGIDPVNYNTEMQGSTIDMWMAFVFGFGNDVMGTINPSEYNYADAEVKRLAKELGWQVEEVQAAIWVPIKARGNATRTAMEKHAMRKGWYEWVDVKEEDLEDDLVDIKTPNKKGKKTRVVKEKHQRAFLEHWLDIALIGPVTQPMFDKANYNYASAFKDIYDGTIDLRSYVDELPFELVPPPLASYTMFSQSATHQDDYDMPEQPSLAQKDALVDIARRVNNGELPREQLNSALMNIIDKGNLRESTYKDLMGANKSAFVNGLKRARMAIASGNYISRFSKGYENVQKVLLAFTQRKDTLIADAVNVRMSEWIVGSTNDADIEAVGNALLDRTDKAYTADSPEYQTLIAPLSDKQRKMFDQATAMIAQRLKDEFKAETATFSTALNPEQFAAWQEKRKSQIEYWVAHGYVPERRYGDHAVHIYLPTDKSGTASRMTLQFEQFESEAEAKLTVEKYQEILNRESPELVVEYGYKYKQERDSSLSFQKFLETARRHGIELSQGAKERLAKSLIATDSIRRNRIFRRKNIPGYSRDIMRVMTEYAVMMANKIAHSEFGGAIEDSLKGLSVDVQRDGANVMTPTTAQGTNLWRADGPQSGFYRKQADELVDYVLSPPMTGRWSQKFRMLAALHFLGGSIAAGLVQLSSLAMNTTPWLYQFTPYTNAFTKVSAAAALTGKNLGALTDLAKLKDRGLAIPGVDEIVGLRDALMLAGENGLTLDTEIHQITGMTRESILGKSRTKQKALNAWMYPFRKTEQINRISTFIAAYRIGQENKLSGRDLYKFAEGAVHNTQFRYDEANRPAIARDPFMAVLFTFKTYPLYMMEMIETLFRQSPKAAAVMLGSLALAAGTEGLPFAEDLMDLVDTISQRLFGSPFNTKRWVHTLAKDASEALVGVDLSGVVLRGVVNEVTGMSFASRVGLGNLIPGTRLGAADNDYARTASEILGPVGSMVTGVAKGAGLLLKGDFVDAVKQAAPLGVQNLVKGAQQLDRGYAADAQGRKLIDVSTPAAFVQSLGFSSSALAKAYEMDRMDKQTLAFYTMAKDDFTKDYVNAIKDGNPEKAREILAEVTKWNQSHPEMPMTFSPGVVRRRIIEAGLPLNERTLRMLPRHLRGSSLSLESKE